MHRRWLAVVLMVIAVVALAGCGSDNDDDNTDSNAPTATIAASGGTSASGVSTEGTFTAEELELWGEDLVTAIATGDNAALTSLLTGIVPQERIDEIAACKPDDFSADNIFVSVIVDPPTMRIEGTVDVTSGGNTETKVVLWNTELTEVSEGVYNLSSLPSGCPFVFQ
ncbi:MAG TPA: hypothetical protein VEX37_13310 [Thermomicrobiales bacterium]|nr:hypothetical protein [Thermomicrobiales bacterium]